MFKGEGSGAEAGGRWFIGGQERSVIILKPTQLGLRLVSGGVRMGKIILGLDVEDKKRRVRPFTQHFAVFVWELMPIDAVSNSIGVGGGDFCEFRFNRYHVSNWFLGSRRLLLNARDAGFGRFGWEELVGVGRFAK
jgi:hypothetical protein